VEDRRPIDPAGIPSRTSIRSSHIWDLADDDLRFASVLAYTPWSTKASEEDSRSPSQPRICCSSTAPSTP
jgi:hypothetical protein